MNASQLTTSVPTELKQWFRSGAKGAETPELKVLLERLLSNSLMDAVWKKLNELGYIDAFGLARHPVYFLMDVTGIYKEWNAVPRKTTNQLTKETIKIMEDAKELAQRIRGSQVDIGAEYP